MILSQKYTPASFATYNYGSYKPIKIHPRHYSQSPTPSLRQRLHVIQHNRLSTLNDEFQRLISIQHIKERIIDLNDFYGNLPVDALVAFGRSLELNVSDTHYICWHSAGKKELTLRILFTELFFNKFKEPQLNFEILLRHPSLFSPSEDYLNIEWLKNNLTGKENKTDDYFRKFLISADYRWGNSHIDESAISFMISPKKLSYKAYDEAKATIIKSSIPQEKVQFFTEKFDAITSEVYSDHDLDLGDLYVICIPKPEFNNFGYISFPFGAPFQLREGLETELEKGQKNKTLLNQNNKISQLRLLGKNLIPISKAQAEKLNPDVATLIFPTMDDKKYHELKQKIRSLVGE